MHLAVGLPLTWVSEQKERFRKYLTQKKEVRFICYDKLFTVRIVGCDMFPQGFATIADKLTDFQETTMLCDIGNVEYHDRQQWKA